MTKNQQSSIDRLPEDVRQKLYELLRDPRVTQLDATAKINEILEAEGHPERVSKSAVNRLSVKMDKVGEKLRQSREMAQMWIGKLGAEPEGNVGRLVNEIIKDLAFNTAIHLREDEEPAAPKLIRDLAIAVKELEKAASENVKREKEITQKALKDAAETAVKTAKQAGVSQDTIDIIRRDVLRISE